MFEELIGQDHTGGSEDHLSVPSSRIQIRPATSEDAAVVASLAAALAQSFGFSRTNFDSSYAALLDTSDACLLVAAEDHDGVGYLLGVRYLTFYANGPVASVQEILVRDGHRGRGVGRALMEAFEGWAARQGCALVTLASRRAVPFYLALGYEQSASHLRKMLPGDVD
jgi:GNAT superfamily N-acetyltransferase